jgi:hypothetical protein
VTRAVGGVHGRLLDDIDPLLDTLLRLASERGLDVDLHVDESGDPAATALAHVLQLIRTEAQPVPALGKRAGRLRSLGRAIILP